jgi:2-oxoisovalerate ferredoxin oxidoreductase beta subunit
LSEYQLIHRKSDVFFDRFLRKDELQNQTHYCPGCGHGVVHKLIAEALHDLGLQDRTILVTPVGCSVFGYYYFDTGNVQAAHGRAAAVATGLKRAHPESIVISYQGDGDLAAIGTAEIVHAANRGENITVFFVNNSIYGMTGGQMAPTTLIGQASTTSPWGRRAGNDGFPIRISELLATLQAPAYIERVALNDNKNIVKTRRAVRKALENQKNGVGFSLVEILSPCPTILKMEPVVARKWVGDSLAKQFPLGVFRDAKPEIPATAEPPRKTPQEVVGSSVRETASAAAGKARTREITIKIAGFGGQGVLLLGQLLAEMGMREGMEVSWLPSYGPEMRSGSCHCHVCLSHERIGSPVITHPAALIAMNEVSLRKFGPQVAPGGLIVYGRDRLPEDLALDGANVICVPASEMADALGSPKVANAVLLGVLLAETGCLPWESAIGALKNAVRNQKLLDLDLQALAAGREFLQTQVRVGPVSQPDGFAG